MPNIYQPIIGQNFITEYCEVTVKNRRYIIDLADMDKLSAYPLSELVSFGESFDFIVKNFPDYEHCNEAADLDDLDCLIDNECDSEKLTRLTAQWGSDPVSWEEARDELYKRMLEKAIENYKNQL